MDYKGPDYLRLKLAARHDRVRLRYRFYEQKNELMMHSPMMPPQLLRLYNTKMDWCTKAVDFLADRLVVSGFSPDTFGMWDIFQQNNPDIIFDSAVLSALISSCCFIYISPDETGFPRLQVIDGANATGIIDPITSLLREGYAVLDTDPETGKPTLEAYFTPESTQYFAHGEMVEEVPNPALYPLLVPIIYKPDAKRPFGHSRISRSMMQTQDDAARCLEDLKVCTDFYSIGQKYIVGLSMDAEPLDKNKATYSTFLQFTKDEDGSNPSLGQFQSQSPEAIIAAFRQHANSFAGATGLTMDDLGYASANPTTAEAIKAAHEGLRNTARKAQRTFGSGFINTGYLAACLRDGQAYTRDRVYDTKVVWEPIIEPDAAMLSSIGDGAIKLNQAVPNFLDADGLSRMTGIKTGGANG